MGGAGLLLESLLTSQLRLGGTIQVEDAGSPATDDERHGRLDLCQAKNGSGVSAAISSPVSGRSLFLCIWPRHRVGHHHFVPLSGARTASAAARAVEPVAIPSSNAGTITDLSRIDTPCRFPVWLPSVRAS